jgi:hypothetical protein
VAFMKLIVAFNNMLLLRKDRDESPFRSSWALKMILWRVVIWSVSANKA